MSDALTDTRSSIYPYWCPHCGNHINDENTPHARYCGYCPVVGPDLQRPIVTDVCEECGESGRDIARAGHLIGCSKNPNTKWPSVSGALSLCEELEPAPTMRELGERLIEMADGAEYRPEQIAGQPADGFIAEAIAEATGQTPPGPKPILPTDSAERKNTPICTGVFDYFPRALAYISRVSKQGQIQHNLPKLGWDKTKSTDHPDCIARHLIERGTRDPLDGLRHSGKLGWRALANLEIELEEAEKNGEAW
jgi:hypothetical protein